MASISALATAYAVPVRPNYTTLDRRAQSVTIGGKVAELGQQISPPLHDKSTVYRLSKWDGIANPGYVIKIYQTPGHNVDDKEIKGLKAVGQFIAAAGDTVVMKEVKGISLAQMMADIPNPRKAFVDHWKPIVAAAAADIAKAKGMLHGDLNMNNIMVNGDHVQFIDWEHFFEKDANIVHDKNGFTDDKNKIAAKLDIVWDPTATPFEFKKHNSPGSPGKKPASHSTSPGTKPASPLASPSKKSPKHRSVGRREVFSD